MIQYIILAEEITPIISKLFCRIALARTSSTILNRQGENGQPCLVPDFSGIASSFSPFSLMLATGLLYIAFIMFRNGHPKDAAYQIMIDDHFVVFLDSVGKNFIEYFCIDIHKENWSEVLFLCWVFVWFRYQSNCGFIERIGQSTFCFYFVEQL